MTVAAPIDRGPNLQERRPTPFVRELAMHAPIASLAADLALGLPGHRSRNAHVLFEVPAAGGIPDVLRIAFDPAQLRRRDQLGLAPVTDLTELRVLIAVATGPQTLSVVAQAARVTAAHLRRAVLPALAELGWLAPLTGRGERTVVNPAVKYRELARSVVTVEAKRRDWAGAITQARRHQSCADRAYIAIDAATPGPLLRFAAELSHSGIGLVTVNADTMAAQVVARPTIGLARPDEHALIAERAWSLVLSGRTCWETFDVFGRDLTA